MAVGIVGIVVRDRADRAEDVQRIITKYGDLIISRMGVPSRDRSTGIITIALETDETGITEFIHSLKEIEGVSAD